VGKTNIAPTNGQAALVANPPLTEPKLDLNEFRINQDFSLHVQARKTAVCVPVQRPDRQQWVFLHPDPAWRVHVALLEDKSNRRSYLVAPEIVPDVTEDLTAKLLIAYVTRTGNPGLWGVRLPDEGGRIDTFNESALAIIASHTNQWIRILCDQADKSYSVLEAGPVELPAPRWPEGGFQWMFDTAFKNRVIRSTEHPLLQALRGAV
jgi:hypothetical protein